MLRRRWIAWVLVPPLIVVAGLVALRIGARIWFHHHYPYGWSHCCDKALHLALWQYAQDHGGAFPAGESSPEASLSLLYRSNYGVNAELLRGKTVPVEVVQAVLDRGELLGPDTCGWHYVEGLRLDDDPRLALFWDKVGLDHNGGRLPGGGYFVIFLHCNGQHIPASDWPEFLAQQEELLKQRTGKAKNAANR